MSPMRERICNPRGIIFGVQSFSIHDGPGIRTTVFFKGCNLRCLWCHNPESISFSPQLSFVEKKCTLCGACAAACPQVHTIEAGAHRVHWDACALREDCAAVCCAGALEIVGRQVDAGEVVEEALRDRRYYETSGGGVTLSGGEPLCQPEFARAVLERLKDAGVHTAVETNGAVDYCVYESVLHCTDLFLFDYKLTDEEAHTKYTGVSNRSIRSNLERLGGANARILLRCPIIPGINDNHRHLAAIAELVDKNKGVAGFELMPYHRLGLSKARQLGRGNAPEYPVPDARTVERWTNTVNSLRTNNTAPR